MRIRTTSILFLGAALLLLTPAVGGAQDDKPVHVNLGGGPTFVLGDFGTHFATGWGPAIGVTFDAPSKKVAFQFEYAYRWFNIKDNAPLPPGVLAAGFSANHQTHQLDFNVIGNLTPPDSTARVYVVAGPGAYYRQVQITQYSGTGYICDPYWYVCGTYTVNEVLATRGGWDMGFNVGGGVGIKMGDQAEFYIETRYHYVWGPDIQPRVTPHDTTTTGGTANGSYWPLTFGFRF